MEDTVARCSRASLNFLISSSCTAVSRTSAPTWAGNAPWMSPVLRMFGAFSSRRPASGSP
eukprot:7479577-Pyramimonas_sp.AAC.1